MLGMLAKLPFSTDLIWLKPSPSLQKCQKIVERYNSLSPLVNRNPRLSRNEVMKKSKFPA